MSGIASKLRSRWVEVLWGLFAAANVVVIVIVSPWETIPFHLIWVSLTLLYGFRVWRARATWILLAAVSLITGAALALSVVRGHETPDEIAEVPLMAAMFVAIVWHARRSQAATEEVRRMAETEHRLLERQGEFVRDASHELRTPITVARGHAELIRSAHPGGQIGEDADVVLDELARLSRLAERLLILAAAEHPGFLSLASVQVEPLIVRTLRRWAPTAPRRWSIDANVEGWLSADGERLELALDALIENAVKFTAEGDVIGVAARADGDALLIEVADGGVGIRREYLPRVFDRFFRPGADRDRRSGGTGLGLAIVEAIVEAHGGTVAVESEEGHGARFTIRLPGLHRAVAVEQPELVVLVPDPPATPVSS